LQWPLSVGAVFFTTRQDNSGIVVELPQEMVANINSNKAVTS